MIYSNDLTFWVYVYNIVIGVVGCALFCYWWYKIKIASEIYKYFTLLLLTLSFEKIVALITRINSNVRISSESTHDTLIWHLRTFPTAIILTFIVIMAVRRLTRISDNKEV